MSATWDAAPRATQDTHGADAADTAAPDAALPGDDESPCGCGPDGTPCDDGLACTAFSACEQCVCLAEAVDCDDENPCTADGCAASGACTFVPIAGGCDDDDACTVDDTFAGGTCSGAPAPCADGDPCTVDACEPADGCSHVPAPEGATCTTDATGPWTCQGGVCLPAAATESVDLPAGTFAMGSPPGQPCAFDDEVLHEVTLTHAFEIAATEVTQAAWQNVMGTTPSAHAGCPACPVEMVSWYDALAFCNAMSQAAGLQPCYGLSMCQGTPGDGAFGCASASVQAPGGDVYACEGYRLPTVAEWEYAARAGTGTGTWAGDLSDCTGKDPLLANVAWYVGNSEGTTHPVATLGANPWGLYDVLGNVLEWCWDPWGPPSDGSPVTDPVDVATGQKLLAACRGGNWAMEPWAQRAAYREAGDLFDHAPYRGFRWARTLP